jgi:hypothetical protein
MHVKRQPALPTLTRWKTKTATKKLPTNGTLKANLRSGRGPRQDDSNIVMCSALWNEWVPECTTAIVISDERQLAEGHSSAGALG